jgi:hypothetical protein
LTVLRLLITYQVDFPSKFQSSMTIFQHKLSTRESRGFRPMDELTRHPWQVIVHFFIRSVIRKVLGLIVPNPLVFCYTYPIVCVGGHNLMTRTNFRR